MVKTYFRSSRESKPNSLIPGAKLQTMHERGEDSNVHHNFQTSARLRTFLYRALLTLFLCSKIKQLLTLKALDMWTYRLRIHCLGSASPSRHQDLWASTTKNRQICVQWLYHPYTWLCHSDSERHRLRKSWRLSFHSQTEPPIQNSTWVSGCWHFLLPTTRRQSNTW